MHWSIRLLLIVLGTYAFVVAMMYVFQERLVFLPNFGPSGDWTPTDYGMPHEDVWLETRDGERLHAWWIPHPEARATLLFSHGNAGDITHRLESLRIFHDLGLSVLIYDYRGFGESSGRPSERGTYADALAAWNWLVDEAGVEAGVEGGVEPGRIFLFGRSLGGAVSAELATRTEPAGLILESSFTSLPDLGQQLYWWLPVRWLSRMDYDSRARLAESDSPVLVIHSRDDEITPFSHAEGLVKAAGERGELLELRGGHNTGFLESFDAYRSGIDAFIERHRAR